MSTDLSGRRVLIAEDEPLITMEIAAALESAGALVRTAPTLRDALRRAEESGLSVAIIGLALGRDTTVALCKRLAERGVPFAIYTGYSDIPVECKPNAILRKPADRTTIIRILAALV